MILRGAILLSDPGSRRRTAGKVGSGLDAAPD